MQIKLFISDFDGVIYNFDKDNIQDGLYCNIKDKDPILYKKIKSFLFEQNKHIFFAIHFTSIYIFYFGIFLNI